MQTAVLVKPAWPHAYQASAASHVSWRSPLPRQPCVRAAWPPLKRFRVSRMHPAWMEDCPLRQPCLTYGRVAMEFQAAQEWQAP